MTAASRAVSEQKEREGRAARVARILAELDRNGEQPDALLRRIDMDGTWWAAWSRALGYGADCPSEETRHDVREEIRARIREPYVLTDEDRELLRAHEHATEGEVYEPDYEAPLSAEDELDR